jgi:hypothetical protein
MPICRALILKNVSVSLKPKCNNYLISVAQRNASHYIHADAIAGESDIVMPETI